MTPIYDSDGKYYHYAYDVAGNRLSQVSTVLGQPVNNRYFYDIANRLTSVGGTP